MYWWRGSLWLFSSNGYREQRKFMRIEAEKNVLVLRQWADLFQYSKFRNVQTQNNILNFFTFVSQRRLLELLSYGEYNHLYFSVTCFLKTTNLSVIVFSHSFFVSYFEKNVRLHHFSEVEIYWLQLHRFKTLNNINVNNFSLGDPCCEINFGKTKSLKIARSFCAKVFLRIISIKLFVMWQV